MKNTLAFHVMILRAGFVEYCRAELQKLGLSQGLLYFVLYVGNHPDCSFSELSGALHADAGHTTRSVEKLVQGGFMERKRLPENRRMAALRLTEQGRQAFERSHELFVEWDEQTMESLGEEQRKTLFELLSQLKTERVYREGGESIV